VTDPASAVAAGAGPLIHLDELGALDLLGHFGRVYVPEVVWATLLRQRPQAVRGAGVRGASVRLQRVAQTEEPDASFLVLVQALSLGPGLPQAIQLARQHAPATLLTDDPAAWLTAETCALRAHGTLGLLVRAARLGQRSPEVVLGLLEQLHTRCSLRLRSDLLASIIEQFKIAHDLE
jgi:predicted nucleic acid-binding protein